MLRLNIHSQKHGQMWVDFNSQEEIDAFLLEKGNHYGELARQEIIPEVKDEEGNVIQPEAIITHPATVECVVEDLTAIMLAEKESKEALEYLASTDWMVVRMAETGVAIPEDVKQARALARTKVVK